MAYSQNSYSAISRIVLRVRKSCAALGHPKRLWPRRRPLTTERRADLNYDVLHTVMEHLEQDDLLRMMYTCHTLYNLGIPLMLKNITYHPFGRYGQIYRHLLLANSIRFTYITHLACYYNDFPTAASPSHGQFLNFLWFATNIQDLDLKFHPNAMVSDEAVKQIGLLPNLRHLTLRGRIPFSQLHENLTVPLESLHLRREYPWAPLNVDTSPDRPYYSDPVPFLTLFSDSLKTVTVSLGGAGGPPTTLVAGNRFPAIRQLHWQSLFPVKTSTLASVFPSLLVLDIGFADAILMAGQRAERQAHRLRNRNAPQWDPSHSLQRLIGDPYDLWTLGLRCHVTYLEFIDMPHDTPPDVLPSLFADTHPVYLKVNLTLSYNILGKEGIIWQTFGHDTLRHLEFVIVIFDRALRNAQHTLVSFFRQHIDSRASANRNCRIQSLTFTFPKNYSISTSDLMKEWTAEYKRANWGALLRTISVAVPSVQKICIKVAGIPTLSWNRNDG